MVVQSGSVHGVQVPALQLDPFAQFPPHEMLLPQPSGAVPQFLPRQGFVFGTQHMSLWHLSTGAQVSWQVIVPPQPSGVVPQTRAMHAWAGVAGTQHAFE